MGIKISTINANNTESIMNNDVEVDENGSIQNSVHSFTLNITVIFTVTAFLAVLVIAKKNWSKTQQKPQCRKSCIGIMNKETFLFQFYTKRTIITSNVITIIFFRSSK